MSETKQRLSISEVRALEIVLSEIDSYIGVMSQDIEEIEGEAELEKLRWASRKLHRLLA